MRPLSKFSMRKARKPPVNHICGFIEVAVVKVHRLYFMNILEPVQESMQRIFFQDLEDFMFKMLTMGTRR
jgi:hypothetical protein